MLMDRESPSLPRNAHSASVQLILAADRPMAFCLSSVIIAHLFDVRKFALSPDDAITAADSRKIVSTMLQKVEEIGWIA